MGLLTSTLLLLLMQIVERTKAGKAPAADATHGLHSE
jgi:hypothetical protein